MLVNHMLFGITAACTYQYLDKLQTNHKPQNDDIALHYKNDSPLSYII